MSAFEGQHVPICQGFSGALTDRGIEATRPYAPGPHDSPGRFPT